MGKSINFSGQPIFNQLLTFIDRQEVKRIAARHGGERYVKKFSTYNHLLVMLFVALEGHASIREVILGLLANAHKLVHLGLGYIVKRSTFSDANKRRSSAVFGKIYMAVYKKHASILADGRIQETELKRLYIMDSTTISLFKDILKGVGRKPGSGKRKGGIKAHTLVKAVDDVPCLVQFSAACRHDHLFLEKAAKHLQAGSFITFDKAYVDYAQYEALTGNSVWYVTRLKESAVYETVQGAGTDGNTGPGVLADEKITLFYGKGKEKKHRARHIVYKDGKTGRLFRFLTNNMELDAQRIANIYKNRWQIELLFKQLKQNFPLKYFLGDNQNAIEIQIWVAMLANLLIALVKSRLKRSWAFSNMVSIIRKQLMNYINIYHFLEDPEGSWLRIINTQAEKYRYSLFPT